MTPPQRQTPPPAASLPAAPAAPSPAPSSVVPSVIPEPRDGCSAAETQLEAGRQAVLSFFDGPVTTATVRQRAALLAEEFVPHDPNFVRFNERTNVRGRTGFVRAIEDGLAAAPAGTRTRDLLIAECDYVSVVWKQVLPDPEEPGRTWEAFTFDTVRIRDGRIAEHWNSAGLQSAPRTARGAW
jgi:predicted SnoaL-like aldol condensation-catalyzing enzyme